MELDLAGKVAVVTGGSKGIGLAVTRMLAAEGALVFAGALTTESLEGIDGVSAFSLDLVRPDGPEELVRHAVDRHGQLDILVNNVGGVKTRTDGFLAISDDDFEASFQLN